MEFVWEDLVTLNSAKDPSFQVLGPASAYRDQDAKLAEWEFLDYQAALQADQAPLPTTEDREGYYGPHHFSYWASGLRDAGLCLAAAEKHGTNVRTMLDIGCATGRVIRSVPLLRPQVEVMGCDINRLHVEWCNKYLQNILVFQNHSIPSLPLDSASVDLVTAFSVFTHIEALETAWLMEIRRILRPGGLAWITVHTEHTLAEMKEGWPLWKAIMNHPDIRKLIDVDSRTFPNDRLTVRWRAKQSYSSNVFYKQAYLESTWSRFLDIAEIRRREPLFQDVVILRKKP